MNTMNDVVDIAEIDLEEVETKEILYFNSYDEVRNFVRQKPTYSANISYYEPSLQAWAMVINHDQ